MKTKTRQIPELVISIPIKPSTFKEILQPAEDEITSREIRIEISQMTIAQKIKLLHGLVHLIEEEVIRLIRNEKFRGAWQETVDWLYAGDFRRGYTELLTVESQFKQFAVGLEGPPPYDYHSVCVELFTTTLLETANEHRTV